MKKYKNVFFIILMTVFVYACHTTHKEWGQKGETLPYQSQFYETGIASYYGLAFKGKLTAKGERFDPNILTAASKTIPFNSLVLVEDKETKRYVIVRINDRGPYVNGRVIDLSEAAAKKLGIHSKGITKVNIYMLTKV